MVAKVDMAIIMMMGIIIITIIMMMIGGIAGGIGGAAVAAAAVVMTMADTVATVMTTTGEMMMDALLPLTFGKNGTDIKRKSQPLLYTESLVFFISIMGRGDRFIVPTAALV
ncbi:hypothetical protein [Falsibacillus pallidus]|uniref:hypothetical protein n=1 Tax=Falsibacillus pallidus TaxID=493781 RepID=UPI0011C056B6|nr:hypothetical protein [Falsibacillus pallidus]